MGQGWSPQVTTPIKCLKSDTSLMSDYKSTHQSAMSIEEPRDAGEEGGLHRPQAWDLAPRGFGLHLQKDDQDGQVDQDVQGGQYDQDCQYVLADQDGQDGQKNL